MELVSYTILISYRLRIFENRILRRTCEPERDENWKWKRLHNEELHGLYSLPNVVRVIKCICKLRWAGIVARIGEGRSAFNILTGKPTGKGPLGKPRRRCEDNIRMDLTSRPRWCRRNVLASRSKVRGFKSG